MCILISLLLLAIGLVSGYYLILFLFWLFRNPLTSDDTRGWDTKLAISFVGIIFSTTCVSAELISHLVIKTLALAICHHFHF